MAGQRADFQEMPFLGDRVQPGNPIQVDERRRLHQAHVHHRAKALAARNQLCV
jgi:hypothetical protein